MLYYYTVASILGAITAIGTAYTVLRYWYTRKKAFSAFWNTLVRIAEFREVSCTVSLFEFECICDALSGDNLIEDSDDVAFRAFKRFLDIIRFDMIISNRHYHILLRRLTLAWKKRSACQLDLTRLHLIFQIINGQNK